MLSSNILNTVLYRLWSLFAGAITLVLIPIGLSKVEQGIYFTFSSLIAIQSVFELGLNQIIVQTVSHLTAHLKGEITCNTIQRYEVESKLHSLANAASVWYLASSILYSCALFVAGAFIFLQSSNYESVSWEVQWILLILTTAINLYFSPKLSFVEGCGNINQVARIRTIQSIIGFTIMWIALWNDFGLWCVVVVPLVAAICTAYWVLRKSDEIRKLNEYKIVESCKFHWIKEIYPLQWRMGMSWIAGYLAFQLFVPVVFSNFGAIEAGKIGLTLAIFSSLSTLGASWLSACVPQFVRLIAMKKRVELDQLFLKMLGFSTLVVGILCVVSIFALYVLQEAGSNYANRFANPEVAILIAIATLSNNIVFGMSIYIRSHRSEPLLPQSLIVSFLVVLDVYFLSGYGIKIIFIYYAMISTCVSLPWTIYLFKSYKTDEGFL